MHFDKTISPKKIISILVIEKLANFGKTCQK